ncbi:uncharacterized protein [Drosophila tropicalis]|uniref:uncharacterized protein n=1 Tax=Drosophila tropicalis TaxID=46794 RepID=UPI0035ABDBEC
MAQLKNVGQGQQLAVIIGPISASIMLLMGLIFALFGIKIWGFRRRLTFDRGSTGQQQQQQQRQQQRQTAPRYAAYESQINGTDNAVHGVFRQRNIEEFESTRPSSAAGNRFITGSVPNLRLHGMSSPDESTIGSGLSTVVYRPEAPQASQRRRRREVNSANYEFHEVPPPPTRQPPAPPILEVAAAATTITTTALPIEATVQPTVEPALELGIPNFDHFAEKYELISAQASSSSLSSAPTKHNQLGNKDSGRYVKFDAVDDVPELLTPDDDHVGAAIAVTAVVHHQQKPEEPAVESVPELETTQTSQAVEQSNEQNDRAFVMEVIAGTPSPGLETPTETNLFTDLELPTADDGVFQRIRSTFELNEADILDFDQSQLPTASSPPGFGKNIEEDWENFENLDEVIAPAVTDEPVPMPNWAEHPSLENVEVEQVEDLFHEIELIDPPEKPQPPPYEAGMPPFLPDYEFLMHMENGKANKNSLPNYCDVVGKQEVTNIDDLYDELEVTNGETHTFDELCQELQIVSALAPPEAARRAPPQPAPRISRPPVTLNVRGGNAPPLLCYQPDELPGSSSGEDEAAIALAPPAVAPQPAKRKVRFDTENLQYYQSADMPSSSESEDMEFSSNMPKLFGSQVSKSRTDSDDDDEEDDDDDDAFVRAISEHRSMTQSLRLPGIAVPVSNDTEA